MTLPSWTPAPGFTHLSLKQIRDEFGCTPIVPTPEIPVVRPPLSGDIALPAPVRIASFTVTGNLNETDNRVGTITFTLSNRANLTVYAKIYHISTNDDDFVGSIKWTITSDSGTLTFTVRTDNKTESSTEQFQVAFTVDEDDFDTAFFVSSTLSILDTSKYTIWNPGFSPQVNQDGVYIITASAGSLGDLKVKDAKPASTFTGTVKYEGTGSPFTPNPKTITLKTVAADGTATVDSFYSIAGKYTYDILYANFAPDTLYEGSGRRFIADIKENTGSWKVSALSTTVEGGNSLKFSWEVGSSGSSLTQLSWYIVNPGTKVTYTGTGIPNTGTAYSITRSASTFSGEFSVPTSVVTTNQKFELMLFSGEIVNSSDLARSQEVTIQTKPVIPDLIVTGDKVVVHPNTVDWTIEGSPAEKVEYAYLNKNKSDPNYNIYFDYNPDVAAEFKVNNWGKPDQFAFAQYHYDNNGKKEGRKSPDELRAINDAISGATVILGLSSGTSTTKGSLLLRIQQGRQLLPRTSPYVFIFRGEKALNTKVTPIEYSLTVSYQPVLAVYRESNRIPYGSPVDPFISGPFNAKVTFAGPTNGFVQLSASGNGSVDLRQGTNLTVNTHTWKFTSDIFVPNNGLEWSAIVENFLLGIKTKKTATVPGYAVTGSGNAWTIKLVRDYQGLISPISNHELVFSGPPNGTLSLTSDSPAANPNYSATFSSTGEAPFPAYLKLGATRAEGTVIFTLSSPSSTTPITITVITVTHNEQILFSFTGTPDKPSPFITNLPDKWNWLFTGGVPLSQFDITWKHTPTGAAGSPGTQQPSPASPVLGSFDATGNYRQDGQNITVAGVYDYTVNCKATGKILTPRIVVNNYEFTVTLLNQIASSVATYPIYDPTKPIMARITSFPGDTVTISRPTWKSARIVSTWSSGPRTPLGWAFFETYEGTDPNELKSAYPTIELNWSPKNVYLAGYPDVAQNPGYSGQPEVHFKEYGYYEGRIWPQYSGFPVRTITIPDSGIIEVNLNGSNEKSITVQSSHYNITSNWGTLDSYIKVGDVRTRPSTFGRGLTIAVFNPDNLALEFQDTYDTYGSLGAAGYFASKINSIPTGRIVVVVSYDAFRKDSYMNDAMNSKLGTNFGDILVGTEISLVRSNLIIIGYAGQPLKLKAFRYNRDLEQTRVTVFPPDVTGGQGFPFLGSYNKMPVDKKPGSTSSQVKVYPNNDYTLTVYKEVWSVNYYTYKMGFVSQKLGTSKAVNFLTSITPYTAFNGVLAPPCIKTGPPETLCEDSNIGPGAPDGWTPDAPGEFSDAQLKSNITRIGTHQLGFGIYEYDIFDRREQGVLAQEILLYRPDAVSLGQDNYYRVNYYKLGLQRKVI